MAYDPLAGKDPNSVLGVGPNATPAEIKAAYRKLVSENHPDVGGNRDAFQQIQAAYETLLPKNAQVDPGTFQSGQTVKVQRSAAAGGHVEDGWTVEGFETSGKDAGKYKVVDSQGGAKYYTADELTALQNQPTGTPGTDSNSNSNQMFQTEQKVRVFKNGDEHEGMVTGYNSDGSVRVAYFVNGQMFRTTLTENDLHKMQYMPPGNNSGSDPQKQTIINGLTDAMNQATKQRFGNYGTDGPSNIRTPKSDDYAQAVDKVYRALNNLKTDVENGAITPSDAEKHLQAIQNHLDGMQKAADPIQARIDDIDAKLQLNGSLASNPEGVAGLKAQKQKLIDDLDQIARGDYSGSNSNQENGGPNVASAAHSVAASYSNAPVNPNFKPGNSKNTGLSDLSSSLKLGGKDVYINGSNKTSQINPNHDLPGATKVGELGGKISAGADVIVNGNKGGQDVTAQDIKVNGITDRLPGGSDARIGGSDITNGLGKPGSVIQIGSDAKVAGGNSGERFMMSAKPVKSTIDPAISKSAATIASTFASPAVNSLDQNRSLESASKVKEQYHDQNFGTLDYQGKDSQGNLVYTNDKHNAALVNPKTGDSEGSYNYMVLGPDGEHITSRLKQGQTITDKGNQYVWDGATNTWGKVVGIIPVPEGGGNGLPPTNSFDADRAHMSKLLSEDATKNINEAIAHPKPGQEVIIGNPLDGGGVKIVNSNSTKAASGSSFDEDRAKMDDLLSDSSSKNAGSLHKGVTMRSPQGSVPESFDDSSDSPATTIYEHGLGKPPAAVSNNDTPQMQTFEHGGHPVIGNVSPALDNSSVNAERQLQARGEAMNKAYGSAAGSDSVAPATHLTDATSTHGYMQPTTSEPASENSEQPNIDPNAPAWHADTRWSDTNTDGGGAAKASAFDNGATVLEARPGANGNTIYRMSDGNYVNIQSDGQPKGAGTWDTTAWNASQYAAPDNQIANTPQPENVPEAAAFVDPNTQPQPDLGQSPDLAADTSNNGGDAGGVTDFSQQQYEPPSSMITLPPNTPNTTPSMGVDPYSAAYKMGGGGVRT